MSDQEKIRATENLSSGIVYAVFFQIYQSWETHYNNSGQDIRQ